MQNTLISVIVPAYNAEPLISDALKSVFDQSYRPLDVYVIDDGSTDQTRSKAELFDVNYIYQKNKGPGQARNTGVAASKGELIAFIDADDVWPVDKLDTEAAFLGQNPNVDVVYGKVKYELLPDATHLYDRLDTRQDFYDHFILGSGLYRRRVFDRIGLFDGDLKCSEDLDWFLRLAENDVVIHRLEHVSLLYRLGTHNLTAAKNLKELQVLEAIKRSLDRRRSNGSVEKLNSATFGRES